MYHQPQEHDRLKAEFTAWLEKLVLNARRNYIKRNIPKISTVSYETLSERALVSEDKIYFFESSRQLGFDFEEDRLANAFAELPRMKPRILTMLFVEEKKPIEIAAQLHCSLNHVYNERSRAIKLLRKSLSEGGQIL